MYEDEYARWEESRPVKWWDLLAKNIILFFCNNRLFWRERTRAGFFLSLLFSPFGLSFWRWSYPSVMSLSVFCPSWINPCSFDDVIQKIFTVLISNCLYHHPFFDAFANKTKRLQSYTITTSSFIHQHHYLPQITHTQITYTHYCVLHQIESNQIKSNQINQPLSLLASHIIFPTTLLLGTSIITSQHTTTNTHTQIQFAYFNAGIAVVIATTNQSNQIKLDQIKSNWIKSNQIKWNLIESWSPPPPS